LRVSFLGHLRPLTVLAFCWWCTGSLWGLALCPSRSMCGNRVCASDHATVAHMNTTPTPQPLHTHARTLARTTLSSRSFPCLRYTSSPLDNAHGSRHARISCSPGLAVLFVPGHLRNPPSVRSIPASHHKRRRFGAACRRRCPVHGGRPHLQGALLGQGRLCRSLCRRPVEDGFGGEVGRRRRWQRRRACLLPRALLLPCAIHS